PESLIGEGALPQHPPIVHLEFRDATSWWYLEHVGAHRQPARTSRDRRHRGGERPASALAQGLGRAHRPAAIAPCHRPRPQGPPAVAAGRADHTSLMPTIRVSAAGAPRWTTLGDGSRPSSLTHGDAATRETAMAAFAKSWRRGEGMATVLSMSCRIPEQK